MLCGPGHGSVRWKCPCWARVEEGQHHRQLGAAQQVHAVVFFVAAVFFNLLLSHKVNTATELPVLIPRLLSCPAITGSEGIILIKVFMSHCSLGLIMFGGFLASGMLKVFLHYEILKQVFRVNFQLSF